ncbi:MAG TPA: DNA-formamidopyrimidine glycosylase family protein [Vicinamibacterales bacterium]
MPELPDVIVYLEALTRHVVGQSLEKITLFSPFVLRSVDPPLDTLFGRCVSGVRRVGKRIVLEFERTAPSEPPLFLVIHLMIAGRLRWRASGEKLGIGSKLLLASFSFPRGTMYFTEASSKKRASIQVVRGQESLRALNPGGIEPLEASLDEFRAALSQENHTVKRSLTDPHLFSGIGNAYSDEVLHAARLSPLKLTRSLTDAEIDRLYEATQATLREWTARLRGVTGEGFPEKVTAFHDEMAVHGRFKKPCPVCGAPVQRIVYADNECNYCAVCQTGGRLLADRSLSRLLKDDWPRSIEALE